MTITVLTGALLPNSIIEAAGLKGKSMRRNDRVSTSSGAQSANIMWTQSLREYEMGFIPMLRRIWQQIEALFEVTQGGAYGFLLQDPKDSSVGSGEGVVVALSGTTFQLYKRYSTPAVTGTTFDRKITRPKTGSLVVTVLGTPTVPDDIDYETGVITFSGGGTAGNIGWTGVFYVPVHFQTDQLDWSMVAPGTDPDSRFLMGPSVVLEEIRE